MHQYSLKFIDLLLEDHYQHKNTRYQTQIFSTFLIFQFFYLCFLAVISIVKCPKKYNHIIIFSLSSIFLAILWRIRLKFTKLFKIGLQIFFLGFGLVLTELSQIILISDKWLIQKNCGFPHSHPRFSFPNAFDANELDAFLINIFPKSGVFSDKNRQY